MSAKRVKRPKLERDRPNREWSTLFGAAQAARTGMPAAEQPGKDRDGAALSDTVELGYRVLDDYLRQGRQVAQSFGASGWNGGAAVPSAGSSEEMQQMAQRVMQYGWDFAGLWFEMWNRAGGLNAGQMPMPPGWAPPRPAEPREPRPAADSAEPRAPAAQTESQTVSVSVDSALPTTTSVEVRPGPLGDLVVHALRADGHEAPPISDVTLERTDDGPLIRVVIGPAQPVGRYRAAIIDATSNLPRGLLTVRVQAAKR